MVNTSMGSKKKTKNKKKTKKKNSLHTQTCNLVIQKNQRFCGLSTI